MRKRLTICGFSEFEYRAMQFSFEHPATGGLGYEVVDAIADAHFIVVDADSPVAVKGVLLAGRVGDAVFVGAKAAPDAAAHLPRPIDPTRILRALDELAPPRLESQVIVAPPNVAPEATFVPASPREAAVLDDAPARERNAAKVAARAAVRRAQLANRPAALSEESVPQVLVLDPDPLANERLCDLLRRFGFEVEAVVDIPQAETMLHQRPFAAIFLDIALDGGDAGQGLALLETIHALPSEPGRMPPAVVLVQAHIGPADRVRASLAGMGAPLGKPVTRGDVARALEARGVALPADARRT